MAILQEAVSLFYLKQARSLEPIVNIIISLNPNKPAPVKFMFVKHFRKYNTVQIS